MRVISITVGVFLLVVALAAQPPAPERIKAQGYVTDLAGVVDAGYKQRVERLCADLEAKTQAQLAVVTINTLDGEPIEDYANRWIRAWGVGRKANKGALLLLVIRDKRMRLEVGYGLEPVIPDGFAGEVIRGMREPLGRHSYGEAVYKGVYAVALRIAQQAGVNLAPTGPTGESAYRQRTGRVGTGGGGILTFLFIVIVILLVSSGRFWFLGPIIGSGWSRGGGGGFGGSGGGGGFGGFGGGDSGGGGASSDW